MAKKIVNFIGIGAGRSGSSWIARCLAEHPDILFSSQKSKKELDFFNDDDPLGPHSSHYHLGLNWYYNQFPLPQSGKIIGEFSPFYLVDSQAPKRIKKHFPQVKIIAVLRNPLEKIYSLYWWHKTSIRAHVPSNFNQAVRKGFYQDLSLDRAKYFRYLKSYFYLFPHQNIKVILFDDIKRAPRQVVKDLYRFLGVRQNFIPSVLEKKGKKVNEAVVIRFNSFKKGTSYILKFLKKYRLKSFYNLLVENNFCLGVYRVYQKINLKQSRYPPMAADVKKILRKYYQKDIRSLSRLIKRDLKTWQ